MQRPNRDEAASGPVPYGSGPRSDPHEGTSGRREVPFGPEISWPHGFRQLDPQSREVLESGYGTGPTYQPPAMDDFGDPGYSDPSYDGPHTSYTGPAFPGGSGYRQPETRGPGYHVPEVRDSRPGYTGPGYTGPGQAAPGHAGPGHAGPGHAGPGHAGPGYPARDFAASPSGAQDSYPVTGAQEALRDTRPQPAASGDSFRPAGTAGYPEQRYDSPRLTDRGRDGRPADGPRPSGLRASGPRPADPRLEGMRYDELRYDEEPVPASPGFDDSVEDESWYAELRRSGPAFPPGFVEEPRPSGPTRRAEPQAPSFGSKPGFSQPPAPGQFPGYGQARGDRGRPGPQLSAERGTSSGPASSGPASSGPASSGPRSSGPRTGASAAHGSGPWPGSPNAAVRQPGSALPQSPASQGNPFLSAPAAPVGLLTPPAGHRIDALRDNDELTGPGTDTSQFLAPPGAGRPGSAAVRPGHGLDGPEITSSWPVQVPAEDPDRFAEFWQEDDEEVDYKGLFGDRVADPDGTKESSKRRTGRRRGGSNDHRLWLSLGGVVIVAAAAITGIIKFEFPSHTGPAHTMVTPAAIGSFARTVDLERSTNVAQLRNEVIKMSAGQASRVVSAVYESGNSAAGNTEQIIMLIGGHLAHAAPATSITSFTQKFPGAHVVSAGSLGGKAACVEEGGGTTDSVSMCAWFDNDSFGEIVSPTMNATNLAKALTTVRPAVEMVVKK